MYINSKRDIIMVKDPIYIVSTGSLAGVSAHMDPFVIYGQDTIEIQKSAIMASVDPIDEMVEYYGLAVRWMQHVRMNDIAETISSESTTLAQVLELSQDVNDQTPKKIADLSPDIRDSIYTSILDGMGEPPEGGLH